MECQSTAGSGAAPASVAACDISASPLEVGWPSSLVREDHGEVSPLAREGLSSVGDSPSIRPATGRPSLVPRSHPRCLIGRSCEKLSLAPFGMRGRGDNGVATFRRCTRVGKVVSLRRWLVICAAGVRGLRTWPRTFWSKRNSSLRLFSYDGACDTSPGLTSPTPSWFPTTLLLAVAVTARAWAALLAEEATLSRGFLSR